LDASCEEIRRDLVAGLELSEGVARLGRPGLAAADPTTFVLVLSILMLTALAASWRPVRRATAVDPMRVLRED
jgi:hypothetical protein